MIKLEQLIVYVIVYLNVLVCFDSVFNRLNVNGNVYKMKYTEKTDFCRCHNFRLKIHQKPSSRHFLGPHGVVCVNSEDKT